jgi:hypothetical protein
MNNFEHKTKPLKDKVKSKMKRLSRIEKSVDSKVDKKEYYKSYKSSSKKYNDLIKQTSSSKNYIAISEN